MGIRNCMANAGPRGMRDADKPPSRRWRVLE